MPVIFKKENKFASSDSEVSIKYFTQRMTLF